MTNLHVLDLAMAVSLLFSGSVLMLSAYEDIKPIPEEDASEIRSYLEDKEPAPIGRITQEVGVAPMHVRSTEGVICWHQESTLYCTLREDSK